MSLLKPIKLIVTLTLTSSTLIFAQSGTAQEAKERAELLKETELPKKPTKQEAERILEEAAGTASRVPAAPLPLGNEKLTQQRERVKAIQEFQREFLEKVSTGEITHFDHLKKSWPSKVIAVEALRKDVAYLEVGKSADDKAKLLKKIFGAVQELGTYLQVAQYSNLEPVPLTKVQVSTIRRLDREMRAAESTQPKLNKDGKEQFLEIIDPQQCFTLKHLSVLLRVKAHPESMVYFEASDGGVFPNGLMITEVKTDKNGEASVFWKSRGRAIGPCVIHVASVGSPLITSPFQIQVVQPKLEILDDLLKGASATSKKALRAPASLPLLNK